jgi:flagellar hook assembly protein FlgD
MSVFVVLLGVQAGPLSHTAKAGSRPKAVIIVGPTGGATDDFLADGQVMANQAENAGMDVTRVFHPHATWSRVLNVIQGANLVVYMGHGNGWPSPYAPFQERTKDGFGLDGYDGASRNSVTYYGANQIRDQVHLASNAIVVLVHLCYAAGNGEPGMAIPGWSVAAQRVDNFSAGFLDAGAKSVFAFGWMQKWNLPAALMSTNKSMDELFETNAAGSYPYGWIGWNDKYIDSDRTPGVRMHLDPHPNYGFYRALTGGFGMTAGQWRGDASGGGGDGGGGDTGGTADSGGTTTSAGAPSISSLSVISTDGGSTTEVNTATTALGSVITAFHPNGDGLQDRIIVTHTLSESSYLIVRVTSSTGLLVRSFKVYARAGRSTSDWNGKSDAGNYVSEGMYTLTYTPRDLSGHVGESRGLKVLVLNAMSFDSATPAMFSRDRDAYASTASAQISLDQTVTISVKVLDMSGDKVRTIQGATKYRAGDYSFSWTGRDDSNRYLADGWYRLVVNSQSSVGSYREQRLVWLGAFRLVSSKLAPVRGGGVTFKVFSTEPMAGAVTLDIKQPGLSTYTVKLSKVSAFKYKVSVTLKSGGSSGTMQLVVNGVDKSGQGQSYSTTLPIR